MSGLPNQLLERARAVRAVVLDVDGVLTDGRLYYSAEGETLKAFDVKDGLGIRLLVNNGIDVAVITARQSGALAQRMADLRIEHFFPGSDDKARAFKKLQQTLGYSAEQFAYVGDDVLDVPLLRAVGLPISVSDGHRFARESALWVTERAGGRGAVREVADALLEAQGSLTAAYEKLLGHELGQGVLSKA